ncbi:MAG: hypothetical protein ARM1_0113 [Candidatus Micrarchaeota archaeon]|nr:MAG: hypothetical protein ARM1_0113 [Candidatus Micrarchaeota archaeon]
MPREGKKASMSTKEEKHYDDSGFEKRLSSPLFFVLTLIAGIFYAGTLYFINIASTAGVSVSGGYSATVWDGTYATLWLPLLYAVGYLGTVAIIVMSFIGLARFNRFVLHKTMGLLWITGLALLALGFGSIEAIAADIIGFGIGLIGVTVMHGVVMKDQ